MLIDDNDRTPAFSPAGSDEAVTNMACFSFFWVHQPLPARFMRCPQPDRGSGPDDDDVGDEVGIDPKRVSNDGHPGFIPFLPWAEAAKRRSEANGVMSSPPSGSSQSCRHSAGRPLLIPVAVHTSLSFQDVKLDDRLQESWRGRTAPNWPAAWLSSPGKQPVKTAGSCPISGTCPASLLRTALRKLNVP
ncbi:hypothetical protein CPLU01_12363 [Colletotrichum plurivorum]|uniref:Uncharacterized protein n=1 Tax=Colletotrichum plurivorum TaxID=2175906 RepID=A0A8H6JZW7_9PEZI|nr:hypothetical protein CPLU01_12363 [Colletotrichum plurivorum]